GGVDGSGTARRVRPGGRGRRSAGGSCRRLSGESEDLVGGRGGGAGRGGGGSVWAGGAAAARSRQRADRLRPHEGDVGGSRHGRCPTCVAVARTRARTG